MSKLSAGKRVIEQAKIKENMERELSDIRHEVSSLRLSNKGFAKQLHTDKYVAKHQTQREVNSLRSDNLRIQREIGALKDNISVTTRQAEAREHVARGKQREITEVEDELDKINTKIKNVQIRRDELSKSELILVNEIAEIKRNIQQKLDQQIDVNLQIDDEIGLRQELESTNRIITSDCETLQTKIKSRQNECRNMEDANVALEKEIENREENIGSMQQRIDENEKIIKKLEADTAKINSDCLEKKEKCIADTSKYDDLKSLLKLPPTSSVKVQTDPLKLGKGCNVFEQGTDKHRERGSIVRVSGVGGSSKHKFGKYMEIRATSYSRHVQLNVKLNK